MLSKIPLKVKIESFFHLTGFMLHLYMLVLVLMLFPAVYLQTIPLEAGSFGRVIFDMSIFTLATLSAMVFYVAGQAQLDRDWRSVVKFLPMLMAVGVGVCVSNTKAIIEAMIGKKSEFVRTPKYGTGSRGGAAGGPSAGGGKKLKLLPYVEFAFGLYMSACAVVSVMHVKSAMAAPFLVIFAFGFFYVSVLSFQAERAVRPADRQSAPASRQVA